MKKTNAYSMLGWLAMILTPVGAVIFFGWRVYTAVYTETSSDWLAIPAGIAAAVGLEMVGIFAGHLAMELWQRKDGRAWLAVGIMVVYVAIGVIELAGTIGQVMFLIAPLVYVLVGLRQAVDEQVGRETAVSQTKLDFQLEQARLDKEIDRRIKLEKQQAANAAKLARIDKAATSKRQDTRQDTGTLPSDWRQLTDTQRHDLAHLPRVEREQIMPELADRTRRLWHERLDEIAAQNGSFLQEK